MTQQAPGGFDAYLAAMNDAPLLGHLVLYSIYDGRVTLADLARWFDELGLDPAGLPPEIRPVDAFEKITGGFRHAYPLDGQPGPRRRRGQQEGQGRSATLMVRHVRRDSHQIIRHLVREIRDERETRLSYDVKVGECVFRRDSRDSAAHGAGTLHIAPDFTDVPGTAEQDEIRAVLEAIEDGYRRHCAFLAGDRLRGVVRRHVENLKAIKVRPTGGVYFVHRQYQPALDKLRDLVARFGEGSHLVRVPLPDEQEMRDMVIAAYRAKTTDDLQRLAREIAGARHADITPHALEALHRRFRDLEAATAEHAQLLSTDLDDTSAALQLVRVQLGSLLAQAG